MNNYVNTLTNSRGDSLPGYRVQVLNSTGTVIDIFSDKSGTRFRDAAGTVINYATAGPSGKVEFYFTAAEGQTLQVLDPAGSLVEATANFADNLTPDAALVKLPNGGTVKDAVTIITPEMKGAIGDNIADDTAAINAAITAAAAIKGIVQFRPGATYRVLSEIVIKEFVTFDLNGGGLRCILTGNTESGVSIRTGSRLLNGTVTVESGGTPSAQSAVHAPVRVGNIYGSGGTVASPAAGENPSDWIIQNVTVSTNKWVDNGSGNMVGAGGIVVYGGASKGRITSFTVPDNDRMAGGVLLDWSFLGPFSSVATQANMDAQKAAYEANTIRTTHPNDIIIDGVSIGALTAPKTGIDTGSWGVRLSGCHNVSVNNVTAKSVTNALLVHHAGDVGYEFASATDREQALLGNSFTKCVMEGGSGRLIDSDSYADNVATAQGLGYVPMINPLYNTDVRYDRVQGKGNGTSDGAVFVNQSGGVAVDCEAVGYRIGFLVDANTRGITLERPKASLCQRDGIDVHHGATPPRFITIIDPVLHSNGQDTAGYSNSSGIKIGTSFDVTLERGRYGTFGAFDPSQLNAIRVVDGAERTTMRDPHIHSTRATDGRGIVALSGSSFNKLWLLDGAKFDTGFIVTRFTGLEVIPIRRSTYFSNGLPNTEYLTNAGNSLIGLTLVQGDIVRYADTSAGASPGRIAVASGTVDAGNLAALTRPLPALAA